MIFGLFTILFPVCLTKQYFFSFADRAEACLKEKEKLLTECTEGTYEEIHTSLECLREIKATSKDISQNLSG